MRFDTPKPGPAVNRSRRRLLAALPLVPAIVVSACTPEQAPPTNPTPRQSAIPGEGSGSAPGSASPGGSESAPASVTPSNNLDAIKVEGEPNTEPKVTVPAPWAIDETRTKVLSPGNGATIKPKAPVTMQYYGVNGRSGEMFDASWTRGQPATFSLDGVIAGFSKGLEGQQAGSRVLIAMPGEDGYDASGGQPPQILVGDTLIFVVDILSTVLEGPEGEPVAPVAGLPTVADKDGVPTITIPDGEPPAELKIQPLIKGAGAEVTEADSVYLNYRGVLWADGKVVDDNYEAEPEQTPLGDTLIEGFRTGIIGQTVGSRMLLVIPPAQGYPEGNETPPVPRGATLVYVVDILFTQTPPQ
ncbi:FKBP-type peptidyl-prolyl cis-trans isomerase [Microlunatus sp. Y2014]|uniref:FKBP-type peptidyl-prolyl cis-trans isomerase n=1 Tax=Microlunatus sp. Y2014 TaxID=3418488 RepID=UPI003DA76A3A